VLQSHQEFITNERPNNFVKPFRRQYYPQTRDKMLLLLLPLLFSRPAGANRTHSMQPAEHLDAILMFVDKLAGYPHPQRCTIISIG
jgi:hypothetical protein